MSHILAICERMEEMTEIVSDNLKEAQQWQKTWYDQTARESELESGEEVLVLLPTSSNKLLAQWQGPYCVIRKVGKVNYEIALPNKRKRRKLFHVNMLKNGIHQRLHVSGQLRRRYQNQTKKNLFLHGKVNVVLT